MICYLFHWYRLDTPDMQKYVAKAEKRPLTFKKRETIHDELKEVTEDCWTVEVEDICEFILENNLRTAQVVAPNENFPYWSIYITDGIRFGQK